MKASYYNVLVKDKAGQNDAGVAAVLFNTRTSTLVELTADELAAYLAAENLSDDNSVIKELSCYGFVLKDPETEANLLHYEFEKYRFDDSVFELYVAPTLSCNFNCPYCFEHKRSGSMSSEVQDALMLFVQEQYNERPYQTLKIVWYGGEPLLQMDIIEALSKRFMAFCERMEIEYVASVISNTSLATPEVQDRLIACGVWSFMSTIDGIGETHEARRVNSDNAPTYETIRSNVETMTQKGICVDFRCILEKGNIKSCLELTKSMARHDNLRVRVKPLIDFGMDKTNPAAVNLQPLSREEFAKAYWEVFLQGNPSAADYERELAPLRLNCSACMDRGYAIDERGNVSNCGCTIGDETKTMFNICDDVNSRSVNWDLISWYGSKNPLDMPYCRTCRVLPLCQGGCLRISDPEPFHNCSPLRYCIEDMVWGYHNALTKDCDSGLGCAQAKA